LEIAYSQFSNVSSLLINQTVNIINDIVLFVTLIFLTFYFLLEEEALRSFLMSILPHKNQISVFNIIHKTNKKTGLWLRGQLVVSTTIGLMTYIGLSIMGVKFPLVLAIISGVTSIVPLAGPIVGAIPAILVGLTQSVWIALGTVLIAVLIQQIEGQFIPPKIMGKIVGLSPVTILVSLLIGSQLAGIWGMLIAIPTAAAISVLVDERNSLN
jgi:predicted PurR-regulated permease PerM